MKIEGAKELTLKLNEMVNKSKREDDASVIVGYTAAYALYVHENLEMKLRGLPRPRGRGNYWDPPGRGQSKFLEEPARRLSGELADIVKNAMKRGVRLGQALLMAGYRLQRESQLLVPVDTGNLKASAFTRLEKK